TLTGDKADSYTVIPQYNGNPVGDLEVPVELKAGDTPDGTQSTFATPSPQSIIANGTDTSTLTFTAKDAKGNVINDLTDVTFAVTAADVTPQLAGKAASPVTVSAVTNAGNGTYTAQLSGTLAGTYTVTPQNGGSPVGSLSDTVTLTADTNPSP
ncbi:Ig-like domain-containing protein, partial [Serratia marcescens]|uniref:Ig-like domain-containing protein n=1 Tax=Serratia marcescens TaxID=615 RepID=UPI001589BFA4